MSYHTHISQQQQERQAPVQTGLPHYTIYCAKVSPRFHTTRRNILSLNLGCFGSTVNLTVRRRRRHWAVCRRRRIPKGEKYLETFSEDRGQPPTPPPGCARCRRRMTTHGPTQNNTNPRLWCHLLRLNPATNCVNGFAAVPSNCAQFAA